MPILIRPDKDGRFLVELYGHKIELKDFDAEGKATLTRFGETYEFQIEEDCLPSKNQPKSRKKKQAKAAEVEAIEGDEE